MLTIDTKLIEIPISIFSLTIPLDNKIETVTKPDRKLGMNDCGIGKKIYQVSVSKLKIQTKCKNIMQIIKVEYFNTDQ